MEHVNVDGSSAEYVNVADVSVVGLAGPDVIVTVGGVVSETVTVTDVLEDHTEVIPVVWLWMRARYDHFPWAVDVVVVTTSLRVVTPVSHFVHFVAPGASYCTS